MINRKRHINHPARDYNLYNRYFSVTNLNRQTTIKPRDTSGRTGYVKYSYDKITWRELNSSITLTNGKKIHLAAISSGFDLEHPGQPGVNLIIGDSSDFTGVGAKGTAAIGGNIHSLVYGFDGNNMNMGSATKYYDDRWNTLDANIFKNLFSKENYSVNANDMSHQSIRSSRYLLIPYKTINDNGLYGMFNGCSNLIDTPIIKATNVGNYGMARMFEGCTNIKKPAVLKVKGVGQHGMQKMYYNCTNLDIVYSEPFILPYSVELGSFSQMFSGCSNLTTSPILPAHILKDSSYSSMFSGCSKLNMVKTGAAKYGSATTGSFLDVPLDNWLNGVSNSGSVYFGKNITIGTGVSQGSSGAPYGWSCREYDVSPNSTKYNHMTKFYDINEIEGDRGGKYLSNVDDLVFVDYLYQKEASFALNVWNEILN